MKDIDFEPVYGPFEALERAFAQELRSAGPLEPVLVVAPSRRLADRLQRLAALEQGLALAGVSFLTFHGLAVKVAAEAGALDRPLVSDSLFYDRLVDRLLRKRPGFERKYRGLSSSVRSSIKDLGDAGVEPALALEQFREGLYGDPQASPELGGLLELYEEYGRELAKLGVLSSSALVRLAAEAAPESAFLASRKKILYYGFYDLTGLQGDFFQAVAKHHPAKLFYPYRRKDPAFAFADRFFDSQLRFGRPPRALPEPEASEPKLELHSASGHADELWKTAKEILRLVEEEGYAYSDIGVVARTLEPYRPYLRSVFAENGIPFDTTAEEPLLRHPLAKQALALLSWARRDYPAVAILDLATAPAFRGGGRLWGRLIRSLRIHQGWLQWEGRLEGWAASGEDAEVPRAEAAALLARLKDLKAKLEATGLKGWAAMAGHARRVLEDNLDLSQGPEEVRAAILGLLDGMALYEALDPDPSWEDFLETLEEGFRRASLPLSGRAGLGVRVFDAMAARGESFRALFLIGLKEKLFPRLIREDAFLRDKHRATLRDHAGWWISTKLGGYDEERLLFELLVRSARERLYAVYPRSDESGRAQSPSIYLRELSRRHGSPEVRPLPLRPAAKLESEAARLSPKEASVLLALRGADASQLYKDLGWSLAPYTEARRSAEALRTFGAPGPFDGLTGPSAALTGRLKRGLSPSAMQKFADCPFKFFASEVLGLEEPDQAQERKAVPATVRGEIYHDFLESFYRTREAKRAKAGAFPEAQFRAAAQAAFDKVGWRSLGVYPLLWTALRRSMEKNLRAFLAWELEELSQSGFEPGEFELKLEGELDIPLPDGLQGLKFRGRADRVDLGAGGFRVVDYKTRTRGGSKLQTQLARSRALQLAFYLELAGPGLKLRPAGASLRGIETEARVELDAGSWEAVRPTVLKNLSLMVAQMARGEFFIFPSPEAGHCSYCAFASVCRKGHGPTLFRSERAPGWAAFASMVGGKAVAPNA